MKKIKDLIYDYNDIFVALFIIALAGAIIMWRVSDIMAYPEYLASKERQTSADVDFSDVDLSLSDVEEFNEDPGEFNSDGDASGAEQPEGNGQTPSGQPAEAAQPPQQAAENPATGHVAGEDFKISIPSGASAAKIGEILKEAGCVSDPDAFVEAVIASGLDSKLKAGSFTIPAGSSMGEIVNILTR